MLTLTDHSYSLLSASTIPNESHGMGGVERLDDVICQFLQEQRVPGATLAIIKDGRIVYEQGYGVAGAGRRMRARTPLRVASISKTLTAIAVLRLCQQGLLSLDHTVFGKAGVLKHLKARGDRRFKQVTVRHLLQHSAGWDRDMAGDAVFKDILLLQGVDRTSPQYSSHLLQHMLLRKLQFTPGTRHAYSNLGYLALGEVVEAVTGQSYESYVQSLLTLMGITDMYVGSEHRASWLDAEGEYFHMGEPATARSVMPGQADSWVLPQYGSMLINNTGAYGGWVATAADIVYLVCSLGESADAGGVSDVGTQQTGTVRCLLDASSVHAMLERPSYETGRDWYGLGVDVQDDGQSWGHTGAMEGTSCTVQRHRSGLGWALLLNAWAHHTDLDGVVKFALSCVPALSPFPLHVAQLCGGQPVVTTAHGSQCIMLFLPLARLLQQVQEKRELGMAVLWVGVNTVVEQQQLELSFNVIFSKSSEVGGRKDMLCTDANSLSAALKERCEGKYCPELIKTFSSGASLQALVVLAERQAQVCEQEVDVCVPALQYVALLNKRKKRGLHVVCQCVTYCSQSDQMLVSAVMESDKGLDHLSCTEQQVLQDVTHPSDVMKTQDMRQSQSIQPEESVAHGQQCTANVSVGGKSEHVNSEHVSMEDSSHMEWEAEVTGQSTDAGHTSVSCLGPDGAVVCSTEDVVKPTAHEMVGTFVDHIPENKHNFYTSKDQYPEKEVTALAQAGNRKRSCSSVKGKNSPSSPSPPSLLSECQPPPSFSSGEDTADRSHSVQRSKEPVSKVHAASKKRRPKGLVPGRLRTLSYVQMEVDSLVVELGRQARRHCGLKHVDFFTVGQTWYVSGVWSPQVTHNCYHRLEVSYLGLLPALAEAAANNVELRFLCQYQEQGVTCYALFWQGPKFDQKAT